MSEDLFVLIFDYNKLDFGPDVLIVYEKKFKYVFNSFAFMSVFLAIVSLLLTWKFGVRELRT
jgi:hypothetical protein